LLQATGVCSFFFRECCDAPVNAGVASVRVCPTAKITPGACCRVERVYSKPIDWKGFTMMFRCLLPNRPMLTRLFIAAMVLVPLQTFADTQMPQTVASLLPPELRLRDQSWAVFKGEEEFEGTTFGGSMDAEFPDAVTCDFTTGPFFHLSMNGQTAWAASPEQMDMFVMMFVPEYEVQSAELTDTVKSRLGEYNMKDGFAMGEPQDEQLPNGHIVYIDFTWKCDKSGDGKNVILEGFARRDTTILNFSFWANGDTAAARSLAVGILDRFEKLDIETLTR
jgi:hypothetical protein